MQNSSKNNYIELGLVFSVLQDTIPMQLKFNQNIDWDELYRLIIRHRVWHQFFAALKSIQNQIPTPFYNKLAFFCQKDTKRILINTSECIRIATAFNERGIFHCFIKGIVLNALLYQSLTARPCKDIDVWVDPEIIPEAVLLLEQLGYEKTDPIYTLQGFQKQYFMRHRHDIKLFHKEKKVEVELHFSLAHVGLTIIPTEPSTQSVTLFNTRLKTLDNDYNLLYLMIHGAIHAWTRLRWLNDIKLYIKSGLCDLKNVRFLAESMECVSIVEQSLLLVQNNFGHKDTDLSCLIEKPSKKSVKLAKMAQSFIAAHYELTTEYSIFNKMFLKYRVYLMVLAPPKKTLRVVGRDLIKLERLFPYVRFPDRYAFMYYILYPLWVLKLFIAR